MTMLILTVTFMAALILLQPSILSSGGLATYLQCIIINCTVPTTTNITYLDVDESDKDEVNLPSSSILCHCLAQFAPAGK